MASASQRIGVLTGLPPISPETADWYSQMRAIPIPRTDVPGSELQRRLWDEYQIEIPVVDWQNQRFVRISIQAYNAPGDVDRLLAALTTLLNA